MKEKFILLSLFASVVFTSCSDEKEYTSITNDKIALGKLIFNDTNLSNPIGQACASCHSPETGFSDPNHNIVSEGSVANTFGNRNSPNLAYNVFSPNRYYNTIDETFVGGLFYDGRSPNLQEQFIHPLLNPTEMNNASVAQVVTKIKQAVYYPKIVSIYGNSSFDDDILFYVADALMQFETSDQVNPFNSKYDYYLQGRATLSLQEQKGFVLFEGKAKCALCHVTDPDPIQKKVLFTDFTYDNLGIPKNPNNPYYTQSSNLLGINYVDFGIGAIVSNPSHNGKFKVPSLRNVAVSGPYFHNGSITTLEKVVRFYNKRDLNTGEFASAEVPQNVNVEELGNLSMTNDEEQDLVAFLKTLTDGYHK